MTQILSSAASMGCVGAVSGTAGDQPPSPADDTNLVPDPVIGQLLLGDGMERIAAMLIKSFREDRQVSKRQERLQEQTIMNEAKKRVEEMRKQAKEIWKSGFATGLAQIGSGAASMYSAYASFSSAGDAGAQSGLGQTSEAAKAGAAQTSGKLKAAAYISAGAKGGEGGATIYSKACDEDAKDHEASAVDHDTAKDAATRRADQVRDETRDIDAMLDRVMEFLEKVSDAENKAQLASIMRA